MSSPQERIQRKILELRNEIDTCFDRLQVFDGQGLGLNMISRIGQMAANLQLEINNYIYNEQHSFKDPRQLNLDFDWTSPSTDGENARHPEHGEVS